MLVLTRRLGETIYIGDDIHFTILDNRSGQIKIGVHAPNDVEIHREEIYKKVKEERNGKRA